MTPQKPDTKTVAVPIISSTTNAIHKPVTIAKAPWEKAR